MTTKQKNKSNKNKVTPPLHIKTFDSHLIEEDASRKPTYVPRYLLGSSSNTNTKPDPENPSQFSILIFGDTTCHESVPSPRKVPDLPVIRASLNQKPKYMYSRAVSRSSSPSRFQKDSVNLNVCYFGESLNQMGCFQSSIPVKVPYKYQKRLKPLWKSYQVQPFSSLSPFSIRTPAATETINTTPRRSYFD